MPEGDSIWRAAAELHRALAGQVLLASDFRVPRFAAVNLAGWSVSEVVPRGKHLLMRLVGPVESRAVQDAAPDTPGSAEAEPGTCGPGSLGPAEAGIGALGPARRALTIHSHLKMEGSWQIYAPGGRWRKPGHTARCVLRTATADVVGFSLGILEVLPTSEEQRILGHLGPDILGPDWDVDEAVSRIQAAPETAIGVALLDQRNVAGIGNIYRCEACFLAGMHPAMQVSAVPDLAGVLLEAKVLLEANLGPGRRITRGAAGVGGGVGGASRGGAGVGGGASRGGAGVGGLRGYQGARGYEGVRGVSRPGYWVYGREHRPCHRCGTPIRREVLGPASGMEDRDIYFCPSCQPAR